nr:50S ribosomal protein L11 methyltransferase [Hoeflea prorocentri]
MFVTAGQRECAKALDLLSNRFEDDGYPISTMEIDEDTDIWEVSLYAEADQRDHLAGSVSACLEPLFSPPRLEIEELPDIDWVAHSLEGLQPVRAGRFVVHGSHDRHNLKTGELAIEIDAGRAFGTGHHGTTEGCLEMIDVLAKRRSYRRILDLGTGSGVLAIAAAKITASSILATDIDPVAVTVAAENARKNQCAGRIELKTAAGFHADIFARSGPFDLIVANILARPLMALAPGLSRNLAQGGDVILSGILAEQRMRVLAAYKAQALYHRQTLWRDGWVTLHLSR